MHKRTVWVLCGIVCLFAVTPAEAETREGPSLVPAIEGWMFGVAIDSIRDDVVVGGRAAYWGRHVGFDARLQFSFYNIDDSKTNTTVEQKVGAVVAVGVTGGLQRGRAKWYGRLGAGLEAEERKMGSDDEDRYSVFLGGGEAGVGVDIATSDRLVLGLSLLAIQIRFGEFNVPKQEPTELFSGQISLLSGAHVSVRL